MHSTEGNATPRYEASIRGFGVIGTVSKHTEHEYPSARDDA
jgi:hypothetical protein